MAAKVAILDLRLVRNSFYRTICNNDEVPVSLRLFFPKKWQYTSIIFQDGPS